jgi:hypothetical protein
MKLKKVLENRLRKHLIKATCRLQVSMKLKLKMINCDIGSYIWNLVQLWQNLFIWAVCVSASKCQSFCVFQGNLWFKSEFLNVKLSSKRLRWQENWLTSWVEGVAANLCNTSLIEWSLLVVEKKKMPFSFSSKPLTAKVWSTQLPNIYPQINIDILTNLSWFKFNAIDVNCFGPNS